MSISFTCGGCTRSYTVSDSLAGKKALCKDCGHEMRIPQPRVTSKPEPMPPPVASKKPPRPSADLFGFDDIPAARPRSQPEEEPVIYPKRAAATWKPSQKAARSSGDGGESANFFCYGGFWIWVGGFFFVVITVVAMIRANDGGNSYQIPYLIGSLICALGVLGMAIGLLIAVVNMIRFRELPRVGIGGGLVWVLALLLTPISLFGMIQGGINGYNQAVARQNGQAPIAPPPVDIQPFDLPAQPAQPPGFVPPPVQPVQPPRISPRQAEVRVVLSDGQYRRKSNGFGTALPGVEFQVRYNLESGRAMGEKYVLMVKSQKSTGKLLSFNLRGSGMLTGFNPFGSVDDGPFEAWMELESFAGQNSRRVSDTIPLRMVESAAPPPNNQPGGNRPGMPPGFNRGPRGPRGPR